MKTLRDELRDVPGIAWVIMAGVAVIAIASLSTRFLAREEDLEARVAQADSIASEKTVEAVIAHRIASADSARADSLERRAARSDSAAAQSQAALRVLADRAATSSARIDRSSLPPDVAEALAAADTFRLAVTPALVEDSVAIAQWRETAETRARAYDELSAAYASQGAALIARESEVRALQRQHAPRCGWKCGAVIGASVTLVAVGGLVYLVAAVAAP